jgi:hypothetical protein
MKSNEHTNYKFANSEFGYSLDALDIRMRNQFIPELICRIL